MALVRRRIRAIYKKMKKILTWRRGEYFEIKHASLREKVANLPQINSQICEKKLGKKVFYSAKQSPHSNTGEKWLVHYAAVEELI